MRMITIPNQSSVAKAYQEFDDEGRMKPSAFYDRLVDVMEELFKFTLCDLKCQIPILRVRALILRRPACQLFPRALTAPLEREVPTHDRSHPSFCHRRTRGDPRSGLPCGSVLLHWATRNPRIR